MKKYGFMPVMNLAFFSWAFSCPMFVEFFPDPKNVSDQEGEYVEIRLDEFRAESLFVRFESKEILAMAWPQADRLVLVHDSAYCPQRKKVACNLLGKVSLPNTRASIWKVWSGTCLDSVTVPKPKPGHAIQRIGETDEWVFVDGTFGAADPEYEIGVDDCALGRISADYADGAWNVTSFLSGCDSSVISFRYLNLWERDGWRQIDTSMNGMLTFSIPSEGALWMHAELPEDAAPLNNVRDTLFVIAPLDSIVNRNGGRQDYLTEKSSKKSPLLMTEVHHCPEEPMPEWVELYNASHYALPLESFRFCDRGGVLGVPGDSIRPFQTLLVSKDTSSLRMALGISDIRLIQVSLGFLNNNEGSLSLCFGNTVIDSVYWNKKTVSCPSGFNPLTNRRDFTPGFQSKKVQKELTKNLFEYQLSSRVVAKKGSPLRIRIESEHDVELSLLDSAGRRVWKTVVSAMSSEWVSIPAQERLGIGAGFVTLSVEGVDVVTGILVRP